MLKKIKPHFLGFSFFVRVLLPNFLEVNWFKISYYSYMEIYIEYVLIDNLVINYLILLLVKKTMKLKTSFLRMGLSSLLGTFVAILLPLISVPSWIFIVVKLTLGIIMIFILSRFYHFKEFLFSFLLFLGYTLFLVGASLATLLAFGTSLELLAQGGYDICVPLGIILLIVSVYVYIIIGTAKYLTRKKQMEPYIKNIKLFIGEKTINFKGFLDSGNKLYDKKTGLPVVVVSIKSLEKHFSKETLENLILNGGKGENFKNVHLISYNTISGEAKKMVVFSIDKMVINPGENEYITNRFMLGITYKIFNDAVSYDLLLNNSIV